MSFACKQALMRLIHKHWHGMGSSSPQCNTPTGEGVGGDDFDGEDDDADRADRTTPEEASGTDAEGPPAGEQPDVQATEVHNCLAEVNLCEPHCKVYLKICSVNILTGYFGGVRSDAFGNDDLIINLTKTKQNIKEAIMTSSPVHLYDPFNLALLCRL